jgi:hypothetical protein
MTTESLQKAFCPYGYMDLQWIVSTIEEYELPLREDNFVDIIDEYAGSTNISELDPCGLLLDYIIQQSTIPDEIKDELRVFSNYLDSSIQMTADIARQIEQYADDEENNASMNKYDHYILDRASEF